MTPSSSFPATETTEESSHNAKARAAAKRGGGLLRLVRAALFLTRRSSKSKNLSSSLPAAEAARSSSLWRSLVCGMRPLHAHQLEHLPPPPTTPDVLNPSSPDRPFHDVFLPPPSPVDGDGMSRYTSADDLQALDVIAEEDVEVIAEEESAEMDQDGGSSSLIDEQAEEFIARFYEQMRLQRLDSIARGNAMLVTAY